MSLSRLQVVAENDRIASYVRSFELSQTLYDLCRYVSLIDCKPDALSIRARFMTYLGPGKQLHSILMRHGCGDRKYAENSDFCLWHDHCG